MTNEKALKVAELQPDETGRGEAKNNPEAM